MKQGGNGDGHMGQRGLGDGEGGKGAKGEKKGQDEGISQMDKMECLGGHR